MVSDSKKPDNQALFKEAYPNFKYNSPAILAGTWRKK
jgi:hypothetical protein